VGGDVRNSSTEITSKGKPAGKFAVKTRSAAREPDEVYGFDRLEVAVRALVERSERLDEECADLRRQLAQRDERVEVLEAELIDANQLRQDVGKRIDELIAQIDLLDAQLESGES